MLSVKLPVKIGVKSSRLTKVDMEHKSHRTAITRKALPAPTRWLMSHIPVLMGADEKTLILDYGCGKCGPVNPKTWDNYDPHFRPWSCWHKSRYDVIICNYVLCTLPEDEHLPVLLDIQKRLKKHGLAYITVRNDKPRQGWGLSSKGTYQGKVELPFALLYKNSQFRIYLLTKDTKLV